MFHRCCPSHMDRPPGAAPLRSHTSTAASMTSRRTGRIVESWRGSLYQGLCAPDPKRPRRRGTARSHVSRSEAAALGWSELDGCLHGQA
jgi:hypothetical protein